MIVRHLLPRHQICLGYQTPLSPAVPSLFVQLQLAFLPWACKMAGSQLLRHLPRDPCAQGVLQGPKETNI